MHSPEPYSRSNCKIANFGVFATANVVSVPDLIFDRTYFEYRNFNRVQSRSNLDLSIYIFLIVLNDAYIVRQFALRFRTLDFVL